MRLISRGMITGALNALRGIAPDFRDVHVYGGAVMIAVGAGMWFPPAAPMLFGAVLLYLGLRK